MKKLARYLKPYTGWILLCVALLFAQAMCELNLPNLMSDIVNVGLQQSGIEDEAPRVLSQEGLKLLSPFVDESDRFALEAGYTTGELSEALKKEFPEAVSGQTYVLSDDEGKKTAAEDAYRHASAAMLSFFQTMAKQNGEELNLSDSDASASMDFNAIYEMLPMLSQMPPQSFASAIESSQNMDSSLSGQIGIVLTKGFYEELGADTSSMQNSYILRTGLLMLGVTLLNALAAVMIGLLASRIAAGGARTLRRDLFAKVESFSNAEFDRFSTASLITRTTNDVTQVQTLVVMALRMVCYAPIIGIGGIIMALGKSVSLSWIVALAVIVLLCTILVIFSIAMPKFKIVQKLVDRLNLVTRENLSGMMVVRAFGNQKREEARFENANSDLTKTNLFINRVIVFMMPFMTLIMNGVMLMIVWFGSKQIEASAMQVGDMMAYMQYAMQIIMAFLMIAMMFIMVPRAAVAGDRIAEVLETEPSIRDPEAPVALSAPVRGEIVFHDVSFSYPNAEENALEHLSFTAKPGETTAFIGSTGSGKSTLVQLILRFYDVTQGSITLDSVDIRNLTQKELRAQIGFVPQKGLLFSGDIASNIRYGDENATDDEVRHAAETAQAAEFIDAFPNGMETGIAQGGTNVSGGQKQRLSIARALAKKAPVYIFDDSFSALDFKTDAALRRALAKDTADAAVLIVAQRVSTIMRAEQIIVLDEGKIVGIGTHKELLETCPTYREIAESQLSQEELQ
ncbi:MAG: ABC transporter ATP-binding protein [Oscillospiraceae bacterium]|nr:ABC transporter ATP-binding protein/permease [Oscillospiraceae bacterium]MDY3065298.1 ABC transporter ATP-binding protein [Oscillospiraceae bacterium]